MKQNYYLIAVIGLLLLLLPLISNAEVVDSGECGNGLTWELDSEGVLTISGNGYMTKNPWLDAHKFDIKHVVINSGVKNIIDSAFDCCTHMESAIIPNSVISIGSWAFQNCNFENIDIPNSVATIGNYAFYCCGSLKSVTLSTGLTIIENHLFGLCKKLESITIPNSVITIGYFAFADCSSLESINLPNSVSRIEWAAFWGCSSLKSVRIPQQVTFIDMSTFKNCYSLSNVTIPDSVTGICDNAFEGCTSLHSISIPKNVYSIGAEVFKNCYDLQTITFLGLIEDLGKDILLNCYELSEVLISECNTEAINQLKDNGYSKFLKLTPHMRVVIDKKVPATPLADGLTEGKHCSACGEVIVKQEIIPIIKGKYIAPDGTTYNVDGKTAAYVKPAKATATVMIPDSIKIEKVTVKITSIADKAFYKNQKLKTVTIGKYVKTIGKNAFASCPVLKTVKGGANVTTIMNNAFTTCKKLVTIPVFTKLQTIGDNAFKNCIAIKSFTFGAKVSSIGKNAFYGCKALKTLTINTKKLTEKNVGANTFKNIYAKAAITVPKGKVKTYTELLQKKGVSKKAIIK